MKNRIISLILALALIASVIPAVIVSASDAATKPEIISNNVEYGEKFSLMYAIDAATVVEAPVTLNIYTTATATGDPAASYKATAPQTEKIDGADKSVYVFTTAGVAAKDMADVFYAQAVDAKGNKSDVVSYSVVEYLLERLYGGYELEATQTELYNTALAFGIAAQNRLAADDAIRMSDYKYVRVEGGTVNGVTKGMFLKGTPLTLSGNTFGWAATAFADSSVTKINGSSYTVAENVLIATRPADLTTSYFTTQGAAKEKTFDYTNKSFRALCVRNTSSGIPFIENTSAMNADLTSNKHAEIDKSLAGGNHALKIGNVGGSHAVPQIQFANLNSADKNCFVFETDIQFNIAATNQVTAAKQYFARISLLDTFGDRVQTNTNSYMPTKNDGAYYFELGGAFDTEADVWKNVGINGFNVESGKWYKMAIEYYKAEGVMKLYFNGYLISTVEGLDADFAPVAGVVQLQGQAYGSSIYVDNTYVGTVDKNYSAE